MPKRESRGSSKKLEQRHYTSRGVEVTIEEGKEGICLTLDGEPIEVTRIGGEYHSQLANQFTAFATIDELVEELLRNEGLYWVLQRGGAGPEHPHHHMDMGGDG
jgi:hypothetical protein